MKSDIQIAQETKLEEIEKIARFAKIDGQYLERYGNDKAKIDLSIMHKLQDNQNGKLILVTAISPTKAGEGKSTTTIGLADGLSRLNKMVIGCLREPSLGPVFGLKGGATGGGYAQVVPMEDINLHFTGDMHAITTANNLVSAVLDNSLYQGNPLNIDPTKVVWKRCLDCNDRTLRDITIAQNKETNGILRQDGFVITVATEIMAILCLSEDLHDFKEKVGNAIVAYTYDDKPVYIKDLGIQGALCIIMKEAIKPNLVQTLEHTPILIHGGPFANIAHGCNSIIATKMALKLSDYVVTEAGFGADLGAEKFMNIKCRSANLKPNAVVIVATIRALKMHGGINQDQLEEENIEALQKGIANLEKHIDSISRFKVPYCVSINKFKSDTNEELNTLMQWCSDKGIACVINESYAQGSQGSVKLAETVIKLCEKNSEFTYLYDVNQRVEDKILDIVQKIYGGAHVEYSQQAKQALETIYKHGWDTLPICMAKTPSSFTDDPSIMGAPKDFTIHVSDLQVSLGAGFIVVKVGNILTMPGLPKEPAAIHMGVNENGKAYGIF